MQMAFGNVAIANDAKGDLLMLETDLAMGTQCDADGSVFCGNGRKKFRV